MNIQGREITRVVIVDDDPDARDGYAYPVEDLALEPLKISGPIGNTGILSCRSDIIGRDRLRLSPQEA